MDFLRRNCSLLKRNHVEWQNINMLAPFKNRRMLFYAVPNYTGFAQYLSFGWHGNKVFDRLDVLYTIPKYILWIPMLREYLIASGAVEDGRAVLEKLLKKEGRAVCHCHGGMQVAGTQKIQDVTTLEPVDEQFVNFLIEEKIAVVPVVFHGELQRYPPLFGWVNDVDYESWQKTLFKHYLFKLQHLCLDYIGYPFPLLHGISNKHPIYTSISAPIDMGQYKRHQVEEARLSIHTAWITLGNVNDQAIEIK